MKVRLVFVTTVDGKITKWGDPDVKSWTSEEDQAHFRQLWQNANVVVMGSTTFETDTIRASERRKVIIMTQRLDDYADKKVPGRIIFSDDPPGLVVQNLAAEGHDEILLVGGANIATSFLKEHLIDEIILTVEPKIFGVGGNFVTDKNLDIDLTLQNVKQINKKGTVVLTYTVNRNRNVSTM